MGTESHSDSAPLEDAHYLRIKVNRAWLGVDLQVSLKYFDTKASARKEGREHTSTGTEANHGHVRIELLSHAGPAVVGTCDAENAVVAMVVSNV
jgi:hypothetical protein